MHFFFQCKCVPDKHLSFLLLLLVVKILCYVVKSYDVMNKLCQQVYSRWGYLLINVKIFATDALKKAGLFYCNSILGQIWTNPNNGLKMQFKKVTEQHFCRV